MAEGVGIEPTQPFGFTGFQDQRLAARPTLLFYSRLSTGNGHPCGAACLGARGLIGFRHSQGEGCEPSEPVTSGHSHLQGAVPRGLTMIAHCPCITNEFNRPR